MVVGGRRMVVVVVVFFVVVVACLLTGKKTKEANYSEWHFLPWHVTGERWVVGCWLVCCLSLRHFVTQTLALVNKMKTKHEEGQQTNQK